MILSNNFICVKSDLVDRGGTLSYLQKIMKLIWSMPSLGPVESNGQWFIWHSKRSSRKCWYQISKSTLETLITVSAVGWYWIIEKRWPFIRSCASFQFGGFSRYCGFRYRSINCYNCYRCEVLIVAENLPYAYHIFILACVISKLRSRSNAPFIPHPNGRLACLNGHESLLLPLRGSC